MSRSSNLRGTETTVLFDFGYDDDDLQKQQFEDHRNRQLSYSYPHGNYTFQASVTIRVTPHDDFLISWEVLWSLFVLASLVASYQVHKERKIIESRRQVDEAEQATRPETKDEESVSTADETRALFRRLLLLAMLTRVVVIPIQIWSDPVWCQFFADTLPEMVFASAWTTLVSFWVQLVGVAKGLGTNTSPSIVIQATAYIVYGVLLVTQVWNQVATVLLYALMCCIYAALFGTGAFFFPMLLSFMRPSSVRHKGLTIRLFICSFLIMGVFLAHTIGYARLVVAPPHEVYWWWKYGVLELIPSAIFLAMMSPSSSKAGRQDSATPSERESETPPKGTIKRVSSATIGANRRAIPVPQETTSLLKAPAAYGATSGEDSTIS